MTLINLAKICLWMLCFSVIFIAGRYVGHTVPELKRLSEFLPKPVKQPLVSFETGVAIDDKEFNITHSKHYFLLMINSLGKCRSNLPLYTRLAKELEKENIDFIVLTQDSKKVMLSIVHEEKIPNNMHIWSYSPILLNKMRYSQFVEIKNGIVVWVKQKDLNPNNAIKIKMNEKNIKDTDIIGVLPCKK
jgi:hypothetical protein